MNIETFAKGKVELLKFRVPDGCILSGLSVKEESYRMAKLLRSGMRELDRQLNVKRARRPR